MAIGTVTVDALAVAGGSDVNFDRVHFAGDSSYPSDGMEVQALLLAAISKGDAEILGVIANDCGGFVPCYLPSTGKLKVYYSNSDSSDGPLIEVPDMTALNTVTFNLIVISR
jgi:hypothetical protein